MDGSLGSEPTHHRSHPSLAVMNLLNEVATRHPQAISFASGRPSERCFDLPQWLLELQRFASHLAGDHGLVDKQALDLLGQYGPTQGIVNGLVAAQVLRDEGIRCEPARVLVTAGCQEAMALCAAALCADPHDVILVRNPTYIGIIGVAMIQGLNIESFEPVDDSTAALRLALVNAIERQVECGKRVRVVYLIPDFDNPTGHSLDLDARLAVLDICAAHGVIVLEDNAYGMFNYDDNGRPPTLHALDRRGSVIYLGTYSKTLCPGLRVGYAILPPTLWGDVDAASLLMQRLSEAKSFGTCNTSQVTQAIVGGVLLREGCTLRGMVGPARELYRANRDLMLQELERAFGHLGDRVRWNRPAGGFFLVVSLPFEFAGDELDACARLHGVIVMPMTFFALDGSQRCRVRLAYSNVDPDALVEGVRRFGSYVRTRMGM